MISAGLMKVVGAAVFGVTTGALDKAMAMADQASELGGSGDMFIPYAASFLIVGVMAYLMLQISSIANGLVTGVAGGSWSPKGKLSPGGGAVAVSRQAAVGAKAAAQGIGKAAKWGIDRYRSGGKPNPPPSPPFPPSGGGGGGAAARAGRSGSAPEVEPASAASIARAAINGIGPRA